MRIKARLFLFYENGSEEPISVWTDDKTIAWNEDGSITTKDGRVAWRRCGPKRPRGCKGRLDHASDSLATNEDIGEQMADDKLHAGANAPDKYDKNGTPHWVGSAASVFRRKDGYLRSLGLGMKR